MLLAHISNKVKSHVFYISPQGSKIPCRIFAAHPLKVKGYKMVLYSCETRAIHVLQEILGIGLKQNRYYYPRSLTEKKSAKWQQIVERWIFMSTSLPPFNFKERFDTDSLWCTKLVTYKSPVYCEQLAPNNHVHYNYICLKERRDRETHNWKRKPYSLWRCVTYH